MTAFIGKVDEPMLLHQLKGSKLHYFDENIKKEKKKMLEAKYMAKRSPLMQSLVQGQRRFEQKYIHPKMKAPSNGTLTEPDDTQTQKMNEDEKALKQDPDYIKYLSLIEEELESLKVLDQSYLLNKTQIQDELD